MVPHDIAGGFSRETLGMVRAGFISVKAPVRQLVPRQPFTVVYGTAEAAGRAFLIGQPLAASGDEIRPKRVRLDVRLDGAFSPSVVAHRPAVATFSG